MTFEIAFVLVIIVIALILFSIEKFPAEVVAMGLLVILVLSGALPVDMAFRGFGNDVIVIIFGLLILTAALDRTGIVDLAGRSIVRRTGKNQTGILWMVLVSAALMSSFISNTAATAFFIPVVFGVASRAHMSASKLLMPLAFATILSSSVTLVATSTNIVVSGLMVQNGLSPLGMFELSPVGIPIAVIGVLYMFLIGKRLIPERTSPPDSVKEMSAHIFMTEALVLPGSPLIGKSLSETGLGRDLDLTVVKVIRNKGTSLVPDADLRLEANDLLMLEGQRDEILRLRSEVGIDLKADVELNDPRLQSNDFGLAEVLVMIRSPLIGRSLRSIQFRERYGLLVMAIHRHGETISHRIGQVVIQLGDILLVQGQNSSIQAMESDSGYRIIGQIAQKSQNLRQAPIAAIAFGGALILGATELVPLPIAILLGVLLVFLTKTITPVEAYREVEWKAIILIGCMLGFGAALEITGTASFLANEIIAVFGHLNPLWILAGFFILTMLLTQPMSNQAAAVVVVPIALQAAYQLGLNPRTFAVMIAVAASCSYLTPLEPACLMVYGPGNYRFKDFLKVGSLLTIVIFIVAMLLVPVIWPL